MKKMGKRSIVWATVETICRPRSTKEIIGLIRECCKAAEDRAAKIICFPELMISPPEPGMDVYDSAETIPGKVTAELSDICRAHNLYMVIGLIQKSRVPGRAYDTIVVISPVGKIKQMYAVREVDGARQLFFARSANQTGHRLELPFAEIGLLAGGDAYEETLLTGYQDTDVIVVCLSDQPDGFCRARSIARKLGKYVVFSGKEAAVLAPSGERISANGSGNASRFLLQTAEIRIISENT